MKKIFKKNQIIITALAVMIAAAGYISYSDAQLKGKKDKTAKTETSSETETSVNMDQVLQDMENLDLDVTDETGAATALAMVQMPRLPVKNHPAQNHSPRRHRGRLF